MGDVRVPLIGDRTSSAELRGGAASLDHVLAIAYNENRGLDRPLSAPGRLGCAEREEECCGEGKNPQGAAGL